MRNARVISGAIKKLVRRKGAAVEVRSSRAMAAADGRGKAAEEEEEGVGGGKSMIHGF